MSFQGFAEAYNVALDVPKDMGMKSVFLVIYVIVATGCLHRESCIMRRLSNVCVPETIVTLCKLLLRSNYNNLINKCAYTISRSSC